MASKKRIAKDTTGILQGTHGRKHRTLAAEGRDDCSAASHVHAIASIEAMIAAYGEPQLATLANEPPRHGVWTYELKFDGYRILAFKSGAAVRLISRRGQDWTSRFNILARQLAALPGSFVIDGEVCALDAGGVPSFQRLQNRAAKGTRLAYFVFDLLSQEGIDLRAKAIEERRRSLEQLVVSPNASSSIVFSKGVSGDAAQILALLPGISRSGGRRREDQAVGG